MNGIEDYGTFSIHHTTQSNHFSIRIVVILDFLLIIDHIFMFMAMYLPQLNILIIQKQTYKRIYRKDLIFKSNL